MTPVEHQVATRIAAAFERIAGALETIARKMPEPFEISFDAEGHLVTEHGGPVTRAKVSP